jgi:hypothetical protein
MISVITAAQQVLEAVETELQAPAAPLRSIASFAGAAGAAALRLLA